MKTFCSLASALFLALFAAPAIGSGHGGHGAHKHDGVAKLNLAVEGNQVEIGFESPLINLISFEHAPRNDKERREVDKMKAVFGKPNALFIFPKESQCQLKTSRLESAAIADEHDEHEDDDAKDTHADEESHGDLDAEFVFVCQNPAALNQIEVRLFQAFPSLKGIEAQLVTPRGQRAARLTPRSNRLQW